MGADLTVVDKNPRGGISKFLSCFESVFSPHEWEKIKKKEKYDKYNVMNEFYCRWALKEAYVKALGVGLGLELDSFEILCGDGNNLWDICVKSNENMVHRVSVSRSGDSSSTPCLEFWDCLLFTLKNKDRLSPEEESTNEVIIAVLAGPVIDLNDPHCIELTNFSTNKIEDLIEWHRQPKEIHLKDKDSKLDL